MTPLIGGDMDKEGFSMKNIIKVLGIIALTAVIGFSFAACDLSALIDDDDDDSGSSSSSSKGGSSSGTWPSGTVLSEFGISGLNQPPGTSEIAWQRTVVSEGKVLYIVFTTTANVSYFNNYFETNGWTFLAEQSGSAGATRYYQKKSPPQVLTTWYSKDNSDNQMVLWVQQAYDDD